MKLGKRLKKGIDKEGSIVALAVKIGISPTTLQNLMRGEEPGRKRIGDACDAYLKKAGL